MSSIRRRLFSTVARIDSPVKRAQKDLYAERDLKKLVEKFKASSEHKRFRTIPGIYENTVRRLASAGRFRWIEEVLDHQKQYVDFNDEGFAARLISLYGKSGMFDHAQKVFDEMASAARSLLSFNALLGASLHSKKFDKVHEIFRKLPETMPVTPDVVSYNTVIKAFCEIDSFESANSMLDEMEKEGVEPDLIMFNTLLHGYYLKGRFLEGEKIWHKMLEKNISPNVRTYEFKLLGLASVKRTEEAVQLADEMVTNGMKLDIFCYNALIKGFANKGEVEEAKNWFDQIGKNHCNPNKTTFTILVPFICEMNDLDFAFKLCNDIFTRKCLVDEKVLQLAVDTLAKARKEDEAKKIAELGKTNSYRMYKLILPSSE